MAESKDATEQLLLYGYPYSFYNQKVLMVLHEKGLQFATRSVNITTGEQHSEWFLKLNPKGQVPVLKHGETVIPDSARIISYLEDNFSYDEIPRIIPTAEGSEIMDKHSHFNEIISDLPADEITYSSLYNQDQVGTFKLPFILPARKSMKASHEKRGQKLKEAAEKNPEASAELLKMAEEWEVKHARLVDKEAFIKLLDGIDAVLREVETQLATVQGTNKWLLCDKFTVADVALTVLLERLNVIGLEERFWGAGKKPNLADYYARVKRRDSYIKTMPTLMVHVKTLLKGLTSILF